MFKHLLLSMLLVISISSFAQTYNLHWGSVGWADSTYGKNITNIAGSGINANVTITNSSPAGNVSTNTTAVNDAFQYKTPKIGAANNAWFLPGSTGANPLVEYMNWTTMTSSVTTTITFSQPVTNVTLYVGDMDRTNPLSYVDSINFVGKLNGITVPNPIVTRFQATNAGGVDTVLLNGNAAYGNGAGATANINASTNSVITQGATILIQYSNQITQLTFVWSNASTRTGSDPAAQAFIIGDITFSKVIQKYPYPPTADNFINAPMPQGNSATAIPALTATDLDGKIDTFRITSLPLTTEGVLSIPCPFTPSGATCTGGFAALTAAVLAANPAGIPITPAQAAAMRFDPAANFIGTAKFTFNATDDAGNISNTATYQLPVIAQPPVSNNIMENSMPNTNGATAIQGLNSSDVDGTISTYQLTTLPTAAQGVLSVPCPPTLTGATCTGGFQDLTAVILSGYPAGIPLTATQMAAMRFDPTAGYIGNATFNYNAVDNSGNTSNTANYTIPVTASATTARPPLADNITAQPLNNSVGNTSIPALQANDLDGAVATYTIATIPSATSGVLRVSCPTTPTGLTCVGGFADIIAGVVLSPAEAARLFFDPAPGFVGTGSFTYTATDNSGLVSNVGTYNLPVVNTPPTASNINTLVSFNAAATAIPALSGSDADGTIAGYTITTVPTAAQGVISIPCPTTPAGATCTAGFASLTPAVLAANPTGIALTAAQAAGIRFAPTTNFSGIAPFSYTTTDNNGNISPAANYNIVVPVQPPVTTDVVNTVMPNTNGPVAITSLNGADLDGTIASYKVFSVPDPSQGILSVPCGTVANPTPTGATCTGGFADLTAAVLAADSSGIKLSPTQAAALRFDPTGTFTGLAAFKYGAVDNSGLLSNVSTYTLPVSGTGNIPPVAKNVLAASMANTNGPTAITGLVGADADGTIASYTLNSVPAANQGTLSIPCPATPTGATCTGGFADLTAAVLAANPGGIVLTAVQAAGMRFDPLPGFSGNVEFAYFTTDNSGAKSAGAIYTIPVTSLPPVSNAIVAPAMSQANGATAIPALIASDIDGTIAGYSIESLPATSQGVISIPCPATPTGATCTGGFADLTAAVLANYPIGGIPLTPAQMAGMRFDPAAGYAGNVVFNYHATDNSGMISNSSTYTIPVSNLAPKSEDIVAPKMNNANGPTAIPTLSAIDADGTINNYVITSVPPVSQGVISIPCPATPAGATCTGGFADLTAAVLAANSGGIVLTAAQAAGLRFDPATGYDGNITFNYAAYDNNGNISNVATYTIPTGTVAILPISITNFSGQRNNNDIVLNWRTENEINVSNFEIEYSTDASNFKKAGIVSAKNNSVNNYPFTLFNYIEPVYFIRLKSIDKDADFKYSNIIKITNKQNNATSVYPNPVKDKATLQINDRTLLNTAAKLMDVNGRTIKIITIKTVFEIMDLSSLSSGLYVLQFNNGTTQKLIKE
jgi:large repetitive protein